MNYPLESHQFTSPNNEKSRSHSAAHATPVKKFFPISQPTDGIGYRRLMLMFMILLIGASLFHSTRAKAIPEYSKDLPSSLKNYCNVCHEKASWGPLNDFGRDYQRFGHNMKALSELDSDGDGHTNGEELAAETFPGNPDSYPAATKRRLNLAIVYILAGSMLILVMGIIKLKGR